MFELGGFLLVDVRHRMEPSSAEEVGAPNLSLCRRKHQKSFGSFRSSRLDNHSSAWATYEIFSLTITGPVGEWPWLEHHLHLEFLRVNR